MNKDRGYSLISVLVVTAIGGILAVAILSLVDNMSRVMLRANVVEAVESTFGAVAGTLANAEYCDNSLRGATAGAKLVYNIQDAAPPGNELDIINIFAQRVDNAPGATALISTEAGNPLSSLPGSSRVESIRFKERVQGVGRGRMQKDGLVYDTYAGNVEIVIRAGGISVRRTFPVTLRVDETTRVIEGCYVRDTTVQTLCNALGGTFDPINGSCKEMINPAQVDCNQVCAPNAVTFPTMSAGGYCMQKCMPIGGGGPVRCVQVFHLLGFQYEAGDGAGTHSTSVPLCACTRVCYNMPGVSPPPAPPPAPAPGPLPPPPRPPRPPPSN